MGNYQVLETSFKKTIFHNENFGIFVMENGKVAKGDIIHPHKSLESVSLRLYGKWINDKRYGPQFKFEKYNILENDLYFFLTKIIKGIPKKTAKEISKKVKNFEKFMNETPDKLKEFKGIGEKNYKKIQDSWEKFKHLKKLSEFLSPFGISHAYITKIYDNFGEKSVGILKQNPYELTKIKGIGFKKADEVAKKIGISLYSLKRVKACIEYCLLNSVTKDGNTIIKEDDLKNKFLEEIINDDTKSSLIWEQLFLNGLEEMKLQEKVLVLKDQKYNYVTLPSFYYMEKYIYERLKSIKGETNIPIIEEQRVDLYIKSLEKEMGIKFSDEQKDAIRMAARGEKAFAISGYAGCGKTTVSKAVLKMYEMAYGKDSIVCCALSGVAANRIKSVTGYESSTIHSLLGYNAHGSNKCKFNQNNPLEQKVVVLDEASMVDVEMFYRLLRAIDFNKTTFIAIGDKGQLPPVGPAEIYSNILDYKLINSVTLTKIYRQSEDQAIVYFANEVRKGKVPKDYRKNNYQDFVFIDKTPPNYWAVKKNLTSEREKREYRSSINQTIIEDIKKICLEKRDAMHSLYTREKAWDYISFLQVAAPSKKGDIGVDNLNRVIQDILNPKISDKHPEIEIGNSVYRVKDKILHLNNINMETIDIDDVKEYKKGNITSRRERVYNGQMGILIDIDKENEDLFVYYPFNGYVAVYQKNHFLNRDVGHGYAMSIHKLQGNEAKNFIMAISWSHFIMLNSKLLYTGITRAKDKLYIVGERGAFEKGCKSLDETKRDTLISFLEEKAVKKNDISIDNNETINQEGKSEKREKVIDKNKKRVQLNLI